MKVGFTTLLLVVFSCALCFSATPVGTLTTFGPGTQVSGVRVASGAAVFTGDRILSDAWGALLLLSRGRTIRIGPGAEVRIVSPASVEIRSGFTRVQTKSESITVQASDWRLQARPDAASGVLNADVLRDGAGNVSLHVSNGSVRAQYREGSTVVLAQAGRAAMLPAALPQASASTAPASGHKKTAVLLAYAGAAAGLALGVTAVADRSDNSSQKARLAELSAQNAALTSQVSSLIAQFQALAKYLQDNKALADAINAILAQLYSAQGQLAQVYVQMNELLAKVASGQPLSLADQALLSSLMAQQSKLLAEISSLVAQLPHPPPQPCIPTPSPIIICR